VRLAEAPHPSYLLLFLLAPMVNTQAREGSESKREGETACAADGVVDWRLPGGFHFPPECAVLEGRGCRGGWRHRGRRRALRERVLSGCDGDAPSGADPGRWQYGRPATGSANPDRRQRSRTGRRGSAAWWRWSPPKQAAWPEVECDNPTRENSVLSPNHSIWSLSDNKEVSR
jgi:hypothetical protein